MIVHGIDFLVHSVVMARVGALSYVKTHAVFQQNENANDKISERFKEIIYYA